MTPLPEKWVVILVDCPIVRIIFVCIFMSNFSATVDFPRIERLLGVKRKMAIFIVNSKIALVFETMTC